MEAKVKITFYQTPSGRTPVLDFLKKLQTPERARILAILADMEQYGLESGRVSFRQIEGKLWEIKISANQIFYVLAQRAEMVLLHAYKKQGQKLPLREKNVAIKRMKEILL